MLLILVFIILIFTLTLGRISFLVPLFDSSLWLHDLCLNILPSNSNSLAELSALTCGQSFSNNSDYKLYISSGLIHLFVVSGSHLNLMSQFLNYFIKPSAIKITLLFIYCAICLLNPPVVRSFFALLIHEIIAKNFENNYWPKHYCLLLAGLLSIAFHSDWVNSMSLQMSWLAALNFQLYEQKMNWFPSIIKQFLFYILFFFCYSLFGFSSPLVILICFALTPFLEKFLFPLSIIVALFHPAEPLFNWTILSLKWFLEKLPLSFEMEQIQGLWNSSSVINLNWIIILMIHLILFIKKPRS